MVAQEGLPSSAEETCWERAQSELARQRSFVGWVAQTQGRRTQASLQPGSSLACSSHSPFKVGSQKPGHATPFPPPTLRTSTADTQHA